jgi:anti-sigma regulatory factor (Ser/Thr protein kinase)
MDADTPPPHEPDPGAAAYPAPHEASFEVRTLVDARDLATELAAAYPDPERVVMGLTELLVNAVEHGNLGIDYEEKAALLDRGEFEREIDRRLALPELALRRVRVTLRRDAEHITTSIEDEGDGFDWLPYLDPDPDRILASNGHGIAIARGVCFDDVTYHGRGNRVVATVRLGSAAPDDADQGDGSAG